MKILSIIVVAIFVTTVDSNPEGISCFTGNRHHHVLSPAKFSYCLAEYRTDGEILLSGSTAPHPSANLFESEENFDRDLGCKIRFDQSGYLVKCVCAINQCNKPVLQPKDLLEIIEKQ